VACNGDMHSKAGFAPATDQPGHNHGYRPSPKLAFPLSGPLTALIGSAFVSGLTYGLFQFLQRSPTRHQHVAGTAAWGGQLALALVTIVVGSVAWTRHRRAFGHRSGRLWLLAPIGRQAALRIARALGFGSEAGRPGRVLLALPAGALFLFCCWRAGVQVTAGLDPNFTVNAWGGPSYAGAMACHYLDLFLIAAGAAWLIDRFLPT
jgi:hypothetical protein